MKQQNVNLKGLSLKELQDFAESLGEKKYRGRQLFQWLYAKGAQSFDEMTDISREFRAVLAAAATIGNLQIVTKSVSPSDGTTKFLFGLHDGLMVESVLIPAEEESPAAERRLRRWDTHAIWRLGRSLIRSCRPSATPAGVLRTLSIWVWANRC
jgi:hypothetical protein